MTITPAELAKLPTAPTVSTALQAAAESASEGPIKALCRAVYGSTNPSDYAGVVSPEHVLAWGVALVATARLIDPAVCPDWPNASWSAGRWSETVGNAHAAVTGWADDHEPAELADLFRTAAQNIRAVEK